MDLWQQIHPDTPIASRVVWLLVIGFLLWLAALLLQVIRVTRQWRMAKRIQDVRLLKRRLDERIVTRARSDANASAQPTAASEDTDARAIECFEEFCRQETLSRKAIVGQHLWSIFLAGWDNSQLEIDALLKNTAGRLFRPNGFLRSVLSLFIIIGLLGTLFGLAASLAQLPPLLPGELHAANQTVAHGLGDLLLHLKGAFAPSIVGVSFTILGVLLFAIFTHFCQAAREHLEYLTLTVWVPKLLPSPFQQQLINLIQTEDLVRKNREHVEVVAAAAQVIRKDLGGLQQNMAGARETLATLDTTAGRITDFAEAFRQSVQGLQPFQAELKSLYDKMLTDSETFRQGLMQSVEASTRLQTNAHQELSQQNRTLEDVLRGLQSYETAYVAQRNAIDTKLETLLDEARNAYTDIGKRNQEISDAIKAAVGEPIRQELATKLNEISEALSSKLGIIVDRFGTFDMPIKKSADKIGRIASAITDRAEAITAKLQGEYLKQGQLNQDRMNRLEVLDNRIEEFIAKLTDSVSKQSTLSTSSMEAVAAVSEKLRALNSNIDLLKQGIASMSTTQKALDTSRLEIQVRQSTNSLLEELNRVRTAVSGTRPSRPDTWSSTAVRDNDGIRRMSSDLRAPRVPEERANPADAAPARGGSRAYEPPPIITVYADSDNRSYLARTKDRIRGWFPSK